MENKEEKYIKFVEERTVYSIDLDAWLTKEEVLNLELESIKDKNALYELKKEHGDLYVTNVSGIEFIFRLLTLKELELIQDTFNDTSEINEKICSETIINPIIEDWSDEIYAGFPDSLANSIIKASMLQESETNQLIQLLRQNQYKLDNSFFLQIPLIINNTFPYIKVEEVETWALPKQMEWIAKASWVGVNYKGLEAIELDSQ